MSDDFNPNSLSKSLRGGVWIKTITFLSNNSGSNYIRDTYQYQSVPNIYLMMLLKNNT